MLSDNNLARLSDLLFEARQIAYDAFRVPSYKPEWMETQWIYLSLGEAMQAIANIQDTRKYPDTKTSGGTRSSDVEPLRRSDFGHFPKNNQKNRESA